MDAIRIDWAEPSARVYHAEYWVGVNPMDWEEPSMDSTDEGGDYLPVSRQVMGNWVPFPKGAVTDGSGGRVTLDLADEPVDTRFVRVVMPQCHPGPAAGHDPGDARSRLGCAIHEVHVGRLASDGAFPDRVVHAADEARQTVTYCSSTDPWHVAAGLIPRRAQTGLDLFFTSGITNHLPAMIPVAVVYSTPEDAAAEVAYLKKRGYAVGWMEMGEERDGQYMMPEDYATLYMQFADAMHKADPALQLGGPVFQGIRQDVSVWADAQGRTSWFGRFLDYLKAHGRLQDLTFVSFEIHPYNARSMQWKDLYRVRPLSRKRLQTFWDDGLPKRIPLMNTESNLCGSLSRWMSDIFSALWLADTIGSFFLYGGGAYLHSPIQAGGINHDGQGWATWGNFVWGPNNAVTDHTAFYWASRVINLEWVKHGIGEHRLYAVDATVEDAAGNALVTTYAVERPGGEWALLIVNRDRARPHDGTVTFQGAVAPGFFTGPVRMVAYGSEQYVWHGETAQAYAAPHDLPQESTLGVGEGASVRLPKASITVLRGKAAGFRFD
ncbi:MAG: glycosyl hydrolase family 5 [Terriglobales bacterium]